MNKPWILSNLADQTGGSALLDLAGYTPTTGNTTGKFASLSYPGASFGATSFTGLEGEGNLFIIDNFSLLAGRHQFKFGGQIARQKMFMDVEAAHKGRWTSRPIGSSTSTIRRATRALQRQHGIRHRLSRGLEPLVLHPGHVAAHQLLTFNLGVRYDLDNSPTTVNPYVDPYNERIVARLGGRRRCRIGRRQEQLLAAARSRLGAWRIAR